MNFKILAIVILSSALLALGVSHLITLALTPSCTWVQILAVGGCDGSGMCGAVVGNQQGEVSKATVAYPVTGYPECIPND